VRPYTKHTLKSGIIQYVTISYKTGVIFPVITGLGTWPNPQQNLRNADNHKTEFHCALTDRVETVACLKSAPLFNAIFL